MGVLAAMILQSLTYHSQSVVCSLQSVQMAGIWFLPSQDAVASIHPSQASMCSQVRPLALKTADRCVGNDAALMLAFRPKGEIDSPRCRSMFFRLFCV